MKFAVPPPLVLDVHSCGAFLSMLRPAAHRVSWRALTAPAIAQGSVITATLIFFVVVVNYIGDVVKQLMATVDGQQAVPPGAAAAQQPAALPAPPPPPDRGHVLHAAPDGATEPDSPVGTDSADAPGTAANLDRRRVPGVASSSGDSRERSVRRTSRTTRSRSSRSQGQAVRPAPARNTGWSPMDSVFPPDGDSDTGRSFEHSDYTAQVST